MDWIVPRGQKKFPRELLLERGQAYLIALLMQKGEKKKSSEISEREVI